MRIAIFGGSFDPPHVGHIRIVQQALEELPVDLLIVVPTYLNPFKKRFVAPPQLRLRWLKKIFAPYPKVLVSDFEIAQGRPTYAIETVEYFKRRFAPEKIFYIIGSDNLVSLHKWKNYRRLEKEVEFVVATRGDAKIPRRYRVLKVKVPISSTELREDPKLRYLPKILAWPIRHFYLKALSKTPRSDTFGGKRRS